MNTPEQILSIDEVSRRIKLGKTSIYHLSINGDFPSPRKVSTRRTGWISSEIDAWILSRPAAYPTELGGCEQ